MMLPEIAREEAQQLVNAVHRVWSYSNAARNNIDVSVGVQ